MYTCDHWKGYIRCKKISATMVNRDSREERNRMRFSRSRHSKTKRMLSRSSSSKRVRMREARLFDVECM